MWKLMAISVASTLLGYAAVYFVFNSQTTPQDPEPVAEAVAEPAAPVLLDQVVELIETDHLLEPLPGQPAGVPFDPTEPLEPVTHSSTPPPIPLADE